MPTILIFYLGINRNSFTWWCCSCKMDFLYFSSSDSSSAKPYVVAFAAFWLGPMIIGNSVIGACATTFSRICLIISSSKSSCLPFQLLWDITNNALFPNRPILFGSEISPLPRQLRNISLSIVYHRLHAALSEGSVWWSIVVVDFLVGRTLARLHPICFELRSRFLYATHRLLLLLRFFARHPFRLPRYHR